MEGTPYSTERSDFYHSRTEPQEAKMSMLAMATPTPHPPFRHVWDEPRRTTTDYSSSSSASSSRPRYDAPQLAQVALPSIRQAIPELQLRVGPQDGSGRTPGSATSPLGTGPGLVTPEYVHSPNSNKRRRLSLEDERDERHNRVPRRYNSPPRHAEMPIPRPASPAYAQRPPPPPPTAAAAAPEHWGGPSARASPPRLPPGGLPAIRSPATMEPVDRPDIRPSLPSYQPPAGLERGPAAPMPRIRTHSSDDYLQEAPRAPLYVHHPDQRYEANPPSYRPGAAAAPPQYNYGYHHPSRVQSLSVGSIHALDRTPFSPGIYPTPYSEYMRYAEMSLAMASDNKQRKRRGNLPKETTDKLRTWFVAHLRHPYPTEDEKQELMRQTGLQMNQISNWFINARRRQLPMMINNARAESDAMTSRTADGKLLTSTERSEYDDGKSRHSPTTSDGADSPFDDDMDARRRSQHLKRGGSY